MSNFSFKYGSDDDNSSVTSGSGMGALSGPPSMATSTPNPSSITQTNLEPILREMSILRESNNRMHETLQRLCEELDTLKVNMSSCLI